MISPMEYSKEAGSKMRAKVLAPAAAKTAFGMMALMFTGQDLINLEVGKLTVLVYNITNIIGYGGDFNGKKRAEYRPYCGGCCRAYC